MLDCFFGKKVEELLKMAGLDRNHLTFRYGKDAFLENCIQNIYNASRNGKNFLYITAQFYLFMSKLADEYEKRNQTDEAVVSTLPFEEALGYIHRNIRNKISVNDLAAFLRLDTSQVYRIFKANTGKSPKQVICDMQIQKCCDFLTKTDLSVREIAEWMGYEYQSHFSKHFQSNVGMSPSEYRKKYT